jgi:hypothetical protein
MKTASFTLVFALFLSTHQCSAGWLDRLGLGGNKDTNQTAAASAIAALPQDQVVQGLREALGKGVQNAITQLGRSDGFLTNLNVKIPMPEKLHSVETALRTLKQDQLADEFVATMNHAAEQAVPEAASVFADAVKGMSIEDAKGILSGPNDAATQYFRRTTQTNLHDKFLPIVKASTDKTGVTSSYKKLLAAASSNSYLGSLGGSLLHTDSLDLDSYVTTKALDGLYKMVAAEEKSIRQNPVARTTDVLQKVFGAVGH